MSTKYYVVFEEEETNKVKTVGVVFNESVAELLHGTGLNVAEFDLDSEGIDQQIAMLNLLLSLREALK